MKNLFKKPLFAALAALMALSAVSCGKTGDGAAETTAEGANGDKAEPIVVQTNAYFAPFEYFEGTEIAGVDVDIMNKVAEKMNTTVEFQNVEFSVIIDNVSAGKLCDCGAAGITITEPRKQQVDFSTPYYESVQYVVYKKGDLTVSGTSADGEEYILWDDLAGKTIGVQMDTTGDIFVDAEIAEGVLLDKGSEEKKYDNAQLAVDAIGANQIDVVVVDKLPASYIVSKNDDYVATALYYKGEDGEADYPTAEQYAICVTKGNTELLDAINSVLSEMIADVDDKGENAVDRLVAKHFNLG